MVAAVAVESVVFHVCVGGVAVIDDGGGVDVGAGEGGFFTSIAQFVYYTPP